MPTLMPEAAELYECDFYDWTRRQTELLRHAAELRRAYAKARKDAEDETDLPLATFPETCPFTLDQIEDEDFWPD